MNTASRQAQRQRLRIACDPCRERKRKCDGERPCSMCVGYGYDCSYRPTPRSRQAQRSTGQTQTPLPPRLSQRSESQRQRQRQHDERAERQQQHQHQHRHRHRVEGQGQELQGQSQQGQDEPIQEQGLPNYLRSIQSNSGAAFARLLTRTLEPSHHNVSPMRMLAWNLFLGERQPTMAVHPETLTAVLSEVEMQDLAAIYFEKVHPCYGFIDRNMLLESISRAWTGQDRTGAQDALLCGVAALACLFSDASDLITEQSSVALAKLLLDPSTAGPPSLDVATAWLLRTIYLRLTAKPEEAWLASCTTLHMIDAARSMSSIVPNCGLSLPEEAHSVHLRRKVFGVAQHLNTWMSYDLGRSRITLSKLDTLPLFAESGEYTAELLGLLPYSQDLDPANDLSVDSLVATLIEVLDRNHTQPPSVLAQCNLMLCIYRRLHSSKPDVPEDVENKALGLMRSSLQAVHLAISAGLPWHHVANISFQVLCMLLVLDTVQSFGLLNESLTCIETVNDVYQTEATREAVAAARTLLQLHRERREAEIRRHSQMLASYPSIDAQVQDGSLFGVDSLQDFWWFNEFVAHTDLTSGSTDITSTL